MSRVQLVQRRPHPALPLGGLAVGLGNVVPYQRKAHQSTPPRVPPGARRHRAAAGDAVLASRHLSTVCMPEEWVPGGAEIPAGAGRRSGGFHGAATKRSQRVTTASYTCSTAALMEGNSDKSSQRMRGSARNHVSCRRA